MGWGRMMLLGDWGQQLDIQDSQEALQRLRARILRQGDKDAAQDEQITALLKEHEELKLHLGFLVRHLISTVSLAKENFTRAVETIEPDVPATVPLPVLEPSSPDAVGEERTDLDPEPELSVDDLGPDAPEASPSPHQDQSQGPARP